MIIPCLSQVYFQIVADKEVHKEKITIHPFFKALTRVEVIIQKTNVNAFIETGFSVNVVSSKLMRPLKIVPEINFNQVYGTAGSASTRTMGASSSLLM